MSTSQAVAGTAEGRAGVRTGGHSGRVGRGLALWGARHRTSFAQRQNAGASHTSPAASAASFNEGTGKSRWEVTKTGGFPHIVTETLEALRQIGTGAGRGEGIDTPPPNTPRESGPFI